MQHGNLKQELPEQKMTVRYLTSDRKVLEIGANLGRNSMVISKILDSNNFVTLETNDIIAEKLIENRDLNKLNFHVENSALSKKKLMQRKNSTLGSATIESNVLKFGCEWVKTITLEELKQKYKIEFDTLIFDCEGAFYFILKDMPEILDNITLIIMENDYNNIEHKLYIDKTLEEKGFICAYNEGGGWGPCSFFFYETWIKI